MIKYSVNVTDMNRDFETAIYHISTAEILVDSIFGIGFKGELQGNAAEAVKQSNLNKTAKKYAVDIPSGLTADGNYGGNLYFETDETLTVIAYKPVHVLNGTREMCGKTSVMEIGVDDIEPFAEKYTAFTKDEILSSIRKRQSGDHKGTYGKILTICGSRNMTGCVYLCNQAAVETGAGLVTAAFPDCIYNAVTPKLNEPVMLPLKSNENGRIHFSASVSLYEKVKDASAVAVGCGLGVDSDTKQIVKFIIETAECPVILDADALNCIADDPSVLKNTKCEIIITPHPGEMARLTKKSVAEIQSDRMKTASDFAKKYGVTVLLKGSGTVIADRNGRISINTTGNAGMARGGSGDVLTGIIAALIPQTADPFTAATAGAYIHGAAGDYLAENYGILAATPTRITQNIFRVL